MKRKIENFIFYCIIYIGAFVITTAFLLLCKYVDNLVL